MNEAVVVQPALQVRLELSVTVPMKPVAVLLLTSLAVTFTPKLVPAVCVAKLLPSVAVTEKWSRLGLPGSGKPIWK